MLSGLSIIAPLKGTWTAPQEWGEVTDQCADGRSGSLFTAPSACAIAVAGEIGDRLGRIDRLELGNRPSHGLAFKNADRSGVPLDLVGRSERRSCPRLHPTFSFTPTFTPAKW